jgi:hypothetical protein
MRLLLAATITAGLAFAPSAFAQYEIKAANSTKVHKPAKVHKRAAKASNKMRRNDNMMGEPYSTQKDEMTR